MKKIHFHLIIIGAFLSFSVYGQLEPVDVAELTVKLGGLKTETLFYGFAAGDEIVFSFEELKGKPIKEIEITELPSNSKFMDYKAVYIPEKKIKVNKKSIYKFSFKNSAMNSRICKVIIKRIPKSQDLISFNTDWEWKTLYDTSYVAYTEDSLIGYDTIKYKEKIKELVKTEKKDDMILDANQRVHSYLNENSSYTYLKIDLPRNITSTYRTEEIVSWAYWIGVGEESSQSYAKNMETAGNIAQGMASTFGSPLAGLAVGAVTQLAIPTQGDDVTYAFISNFENVQAFLNGQAYYQFKNGKGIAAYGKHDSPLQGNFFIGLHNDNTAVGIDVNVKIVVIKEIKTYEDKEYERKKINPKYTTLNKKRMVIKKRNIMVNSN